MCHCQILRGSLEERMQTTNIWNNGTVSASDWLRGKPGCTLLLMEEPITVHALTLNAFTAPPADKWQYALSYKINKTVETRERRKQG